MRATYRINEIFFSLQGEGGRAGEPSIFVRFSGCNLKCTVEPSEKSPGGFDCDTEFESGRNMTKEEITAEVNNLSMSCDWVVFSGGEPGLQLDTALIEHLHHNGNKLAVETNGTVALPEGLDWITLSPKVAEHAIKQKRATELKYVRGYGQAIPKPSTPAELRWISPAFDGPRIDPRTLAWCIDLVKANPLWRLSMQQHKFWKVR